MQYVAKRIHAVVDETSSSEERRTIKRVEKAFDNIIHNAALGHAREARTIPHEE